MAFYPTRYYPDYPGPFQGPGYSPYRSQYPGPPMDPGYPPPRPAYRTEYPPVDTTAGTAKVNQGTTDQSVQAINKNYRYFGYALMFLGFAILGVEIANVVFTTANFKPAKAFAAPYILTWVAPGIWGAIPIFITGYLAIRVAGGKNKMIRLFALFCSLSSTVFAPAIIGISIAEIIMYPTLPTGDKGVFNDRRCYSFSDSSTLSCPKFILPLIVAVLAGIAFLLTFLVTVVFCCCWNPQAQGPVKETETTQVIDEYYPYPRYPTYAPVSNQLMRLPQARPYVPEVPLYYPTSRMVQPDMDFLRSYPVYRPAASRGFGFAPAYNRQSYGNFPGTLPSLASFGSPEPNPAYKVVYA